MLTIHLVNIVITTIEPTPVVILEIIAPIFRGTIFSATDKIINMM